MKPCGEACESCPGRDLPCVLPEPATGKRRLIVLGEAPGRNEVEQGRPFVGASGRVMERELGRLCGLKRDEIHWTNAILCPVEEKDAVTARKLCAKRLQDEIAALGPGQPVLALGGTALQSALGISRRPSILRYRGFVFPEGDPLRGEGALPACVVASVHPAFLLRGSDAWLPIFQADLARAGRVASEGFLPPEAKPGARIVVARDLVTLERELPLLAETIVVDIETVERSGTNAKGKGPCIHENRMTCLVLADTQLAIVIPWSKTIAGEGRFWNGSQGKVKKLIRETLASRTAVTHNGPAYDQIGLARRGLWSESQRWDDSLNAYHVITSHFPKRLSHLVSCYVDAPAWKEWDHDGDAEKLYSYNGRDGLYNAQAWEKLRASMDESDLRVYESDKNAAWLCREMSRAGFLFDSKRAIEMSLSLAKQERELEKKVEAILGYEINLRSPKQLAKAMFGTLRARVMFRSEKSNAPSLGRNALLAYAASQSEELREFALAVIEYRRLRKCRRTYVEGPRILSDGRAHPTWQSWGTVSGRWSCKEPNLANLPRLANDPSKDLGGIRSLYVAAPGKVLFAFDISQAEFRIAAHLSGDPTMMAACAPGRDIHSENAKSIFGEAFQGKNTPTGKVLRDVAKPCGFGCIYLAEAGAVQGQLQAAGHVLSLTKVESILAKLHVAFGRYYEYQAQELLKITRRGYVESPFLGRKRWLGHAPKAPEAANFPIQSGVADVMNQRLFKIVVEARRRGLDVTLQAQVYDAAYFECDPAHVSALKALCEEVFAEPLTLNGNSFVLPIDCHDGRRWNEV